MVCSARCRESTSPKKACRCSCGGELHGVAAGSIGATPTRLSSGGGGPAKGSGGGPGGPKGPFPQGSGSPDPDDRLSPHPVDRLVREVIRTRRPVTEEEADSVVERMASAPFMGRIRVPKDERGLSYLGRTLGPREESLTVHLMRRVNQGQWAVGTTEEEYLEDLRSGLRDPVGRLVLYRMRGGNIAAILSNNPVPPSRRGPQARDMVHLFVVYSADRGRIVTGHQASSLQTVDVSEDPLWIR